MEILSEKTVEVMGYSSFTFNGIVVAVGIALISIVIFLVCANDEYSDTVQNVALIAFFVMIFSLMTFLGFLIFGNAPQAQYTEYKVIFNENINLNDFSDKYEIVSRERDIFTIRDIEKVPIEK